MSGRPDRAWTPGVLGSLISYTVAKLSGALPLQQAWGSLPGPAAIVCLLLLLLPALLGSLSLPFFCSVPFSDQLPWTSFTCRVRVFETWPFNSQKSLGKLLGFRLCRGHIALSFSFQLMFKKRLKSRAPLHPPSFSRCVSSSRQGEAADRLESRRGISDGFTALLLRYFIGG